MKNLGKAFYKLPLASASGENNESKGFSRILDVKLPIGFSRIYAKAIRNESKSDIWLKPFNSIKFVHLC